MNLVITRRARVDLDDILRFIAQDNPRAAAAELARIHRAIERLVAGEVSGPEVRFRNGQRMRRWPVPPYRIYYWRTRNQTTILRVYYGSRRPIE